MKIISWNINGLRAVLKKSFLDWLKSAKADIVCLQEIKVQEDKLPAELLKLKNYYSFFNFAQKPGYSGVAVLTKIKPLSVKHNLCFTPYQFLPPVKAHQSRKAKPLRLTSRELEGRRTELKRGFTRFDEEGRMLELEFDNFTLVNLYLPHGGRGKENLGYKLEAYRHLFSYLRKALRPALRRRLRQGEQAQGKNIILIGDFNVAHQEIDLARPKQNQQNTMFTPKERRQLDELVKLGFTDTFRIFHPGGGHYTWWPYMANARARNLGWRIDYCFTSKSIIPKIKNAFILQEVFGSDHCPIGIEI